MSGDFEQIPCRGARFRKGAYFLNFKWGIGDNVVLFSSPRKDRNKAAPSKPIPQSDICITRWDSVLQETRKLLHELHALFKKLQHAQESYSEAEFGIEIKRAGKQVRSLLTSQIKSIKETIENGSYLDDPLLLAENQPFNTKETDFILTRLRTSVWHSLIDNINSDEISQRLQDAKARGAKCIIAQGGVGDPFPYFVSTLCQKLGLDAYLVLRARPNADHPTSTNSIRTVILEPSKYRLRAQVIEDIKNNLGGNVEVFSDMGRAAIEYNDMLQLCHTMSSAWHLSEIFYWPTSPPSASGLSVITPLLVEWHIAHGNYEPPSVADLDSPEKFWEAICKALVHARTQDARAYLRARPADSQTVSNARVVEELVTTMPWLYHSETTADFVVSWRTWHAACQTAMSKLNPVTGPGKAVAILCGDEDTIRQYCTQWQELFISMVLYSKPHAHVSELSHIADHCMNSIASPGVLNLLLRAILRRDVYSTLTLAREHYPIWFAAHLGDFLHLTSHLDPSPSEYPKRNGDNVRQHLLLTYGRELLSHQGLWQIAFDYFAQCGPLSTVYTQVLLDSQPVDSETKMEKLMHAARTPQQQKNIARVFAMNQHIKGRYAASIDWLIRVDDSERLAAETEWLLSHLDQVENKLPAIAAAAFESRPISPSARSIGLYEPRLIFLEKYYQLTAARKSGRGEDQAKILVQLLTNRIAPRKFWYALLLECVPLLEGAHTRTATSLFSAHDTCQLMACVEDLVLDTMWVDEPTVEITDLQLETVRLALTRNLAKAIV